jgi:hypothetical protein
VRALGVARAPCDGRPRSSSERLGDECVRTPVRLGRHPREHDRADALGRLADRSAERAQPRVGRLATSGHLLDDQARVAARLDPVQSEAARMLEAGQQCAVLGHVRPGDTDRLAVRGEQRAAGRGEHVADRCRAWITARSAVGRQHRVAGLRRAGRWPGPPPAGLGQGTSFGVAVGMAATAGGSAALRSCHGPDTTPRRRDAPPVPISPMSGGWAWRS